MVSLKTFYTHCFPIVRQIATSYLAQDRQTETEVGGTDGTALHSAGLKLVAGRYVIRQMITYKLQAGTELFVYQRNSQKQRGCCHIRQNVFSNTCINLLLQMDRKQWPHLTTYYLAILMCTYLSS